MSFARTTLGKIAQHRFDKRLTVWVEGPTDIPFYEQALRKLDCRVKDAGGKPECLKLAKALKEKEHPYVVVLDGDYEILERKRSWHRRAVMLNRYSVENYCFEKDPIERVCCSHAHVSFEEKLIGNSFDSALSAVESDLFELIVLDIAHQRAQTGQKLLIKMEELLAKKDKIVFDKRRIKQILRNKTEGVSKKVVGEVRSLVKNFRRRKRLVDLLQGKQVLRIITHLVNRSAKKRRSSTSNLSPDGLFIRLSSEVWSEIVSDDHKSLKRRLYRAIKDIQKNGKVLGIKVN